MQANAAVPDCDDPDVDCMIVTGTRTNYSYGTWLTAWYAGAGGGGTGHHGEPPSTTQEAPGDGNIHVEWDPLAHPHSNDVSLAVSDGYKLDKDGDGVEDDRFEPNFLVVGPDVNHDGIPDLWYEMKALGRAWRY